MNIRGDDMKNIRHEQFEKLNRKQTIIENIIITLTFLAISSFGGLFLVWWHSIGA